MTVIGIDPGNVESAFAVFNGEKVIDAGKWSNSEMINMIEIWAQRQPKSGFQIAIEMIAGYGMPVGKTVFNTVFWIGRFYERWMQSCQDPKPWMLYRKDIKAHFGIHRGKDKDVRAALIKRLGEPGTSKEKGQTYGLAGDMWSALAVAVTRHDQLTRTRQISSSISST